MLALALAMFTQAMASPCLPLADRPAGARLTHVWDAVEGRVTELDELQSEARRRRIRDLQGGEWDGAPPVVLLFALAILNAEEGRFWARCSPGSDAEIRGFERTDRLVIYAQKRDSSVPVRSDVLRARADAWCGLGRWPECFAALDARTDTVPCEVDAWRGDAAVSRGELTAAIEAYQGAVQQAEGPVCAYAAYRVALLQHQLGATAEGVRTMTSLIERQTAGLAGKPLSVVLEAAVLDLPSLRAGPDDTRAADALAGLVPILVEALAAPLADPTDAREAAARLPGVVDDLLRIDLDQPAWELIIAFDAEFGPGGLQAPRGVGRARREVADALEGALLRVVGFGRGRDATEQACLAAALYLGRFPQADRVGEVRGVLEGPRCGGR